MQQIIIEGIDFGYNKNQLIFEKLSLNIINDTNGKIIGLMGNSGCGKSTLLKIILKVLQPYNGNLIINPKNSVFAYLPQEPVLFEHLSPMDNARYFSRTKNYKKRFEINLFKELTEILNLKEILQNKSRISELSGGQKQRIALLQALSIQPDFLLLDEPTTGIDAEVKLQFLNKLKFLAREYNLLVIYVTHNKTEAELITDEIIYLGQKTDGETSQIFHNKTIDFLNSPPVIEAVNVFKYPNPNIIELSYLKNYLSFSVNEGELTFIEEKNISFSKNDGIPFKLVSSNQVYTDIELVESKEHLVFRSELLKYADSNKINFVGEIPIYKNGILNRIVNNGK